MRAARNAYQKKCAAEKLRRRSVFWGPVYPADYTCDASLIVPREFSLPRIGPRIAYIPMNAYAIEAKCNTGDFTAECASKTLQMPS
eukprot:440444-Prorocentrum_minimum.AAC.3